jgi:hypothetical protein
MPETWAGRSRFEYTGFVETGTVIKFGNGRIIAVSASKYAALRRHFKNRTIPIGTSRTNPPVGSLGAWLQENVTPVAIASYVGPILILEGYARKKGPHEIRIIK